MEPGDRIFLPGCTEFSRCFKGHTQLCPSSYIETRHMVDSGTTILQTSDNHEDEIGRLSIALQ